MQLNKYIDDLSKNWVSIFWFYCTAFIAIFSGVASLIGAFDIQATFSAVPELVFKRIFWHILITALVAAHFTLFFEAIVRRRLEKYIIDKRLSFNNSTKSVFIIGANLTGRAVLAKIRESGYHIKGVYDKNLNAPGIEYSRKHGVSTYSNSNDELRKMLNLCCENPENTYYIFLTSDTPNFVAAIDEKMRSLRKNTSNFKYFRLGIDYNQNISETELIHLIV